MAQFRRFTRKPRFRRFRRKNQGTWFPIIGSSWTDEGDTYNDVSFTLDTGQVGVDRAFGASQIVTPLTRDYTQQNIPSSLALIEQPTLRDFTEGQDYILKRIVGNCVCIVQSNQNPISGYGRASWWKYAKITAGFFVARAADDDQTLPDLSLLDVEPSISNNSQNPWIWRRSWILANPANSETVAAGVISEDELSTNRDMAGENVGPYVDAKSKRRVRREQRLWFVLSAIGWDGTRGSVGGGSTQPNVVCNLDVRIFGKMVKGKNASDF